MATGCVVLVIVLWLSNCRINKLLSPTPADAVLEVSPALVQDSALAGSTTPREAAVVVRSAGAWRASHEHGWIGVHPTSGGRRSVLTITLDPEDLDPGSHEGSVTVTSGDAASAAAKIAVTFLIQQPVLRASPKEFSYSTRDRNAVFLDTVRVANEGTGPLVWTAALRDGRGWLTLERTAGDGAGLIPIRASAQGLSIDTHRETIVIAAPGAKGSPAEVEVTLRKRRPHDDDDDDDDAPPYRP